MSSVFKIIWSQMISKHFRKAFYSVVVLLLFVIFFFPFYISREAVRDKFNNGGLNVTYQKKDAQTIVNKVNWTV